MSVLCWCVACVSHTINEIHTLCCMVTLWRGLIYQLLGNMVWYQDIMFPHKEYLRLQSMMSGRPTADPQPTTSRKERRSSVGRSS